MPDLYQMTQKTCRADFANVLKAMPTGEISKAVVIRDTTYFFRLDDIATVVDTTVTARHILLSFEESINIVLSSFCKY